MTAGEEIRAIITQIRSSEWTPELFERVYRMNEYMGNDMVTYGRMPPQDLFNILRQNLPPDDYEKFDLEYCSHYRPEDRKLTEWLAKKRKEGKECPKEKKVTARNDRGKTGGNHRRVLTGFPENW